MSGRRHRALVDRVQREIPQAAKLQDFFAGVPSDVLMRLVAAAASLERTKDEAEALVLFTVKAAAGDREHFDTNLPRLSDLCNVARVLLAMEAMRRSGHLEIEWPARLTPDANINVRKTPAGELRHQELKAKFERGN